MIISDIIIKYFNIYCNPSITEITHLTVKKITFQ